jgi:hypothetical protein
MPDALEEFAQEVIERFLKELPVARRLEDLSAEDLLQALSAEKREALRRLLRGSEKESTRVALARIHREIQDHLFLQIPVEKRLEGLCPEELVEGLSARQREALRHLLNANGDSSNPPGAAQ